MPSSNTEALSIGAVSVDLTIGRTFVSVSLGISGRAVVATLTGFRCRCRACNLFCFSSSFQAFCLANDASRARSRIAASFSKAAELLGPSLFGVLRMARVPVRAMAMASRSVATTRIVSGIHSSAWGQETMFGEEKARCRVQRSQKKKKSIHRLDGTQ